jgi:hypothetical protein
MSRLKYTPSSAGATWGWDMGAQKNRALFILGMARPKSTYQSIYLANTLPTTGPSDGYMFVANSGTSKMELYKGPVGSFAVDDALTETAVYPDIDSTKPSFGLAIYADGTTGRVVTFLRIGPEVWWPVMDLVDSDPSRVTTFRYVGVGFSTPSSIMWAGCPLGIYAE